jgi:hypothetical protein
MPAQDEVADESVMVGPKRFVADYLGSIEAVLAAQYAVSRAPHRGDRGEDREEFLVGVLNNLLPQATRAFRGGTILDVGDRKSDQTDIVIYSIWTPLLRHTKKPVFLAEGTYAAVEVKSVLDGSTLTEALRGATKIKKLRKFTRGEIADMGMKGRYHPTFSICSGIFAYTSKLKPKGIHDRLMEYHRSGVPNTEMVDFVCVNQQYCFHRLRTEHSSAAYAEFGPAPARTLEEFQRECRYVCAVVPLGTALSTILNYVSNIRPPMNSFQKYLYPMLYTP